MKICVFSHASGTPEIGPNTRWYYLASELVKMSNDITIVGSSFFHKYIKKMEGGNLAIKDNINGVNYIWLKTFKYGNYLTQVLNHFYFMAISLLYVIFFLRKNKYDFVVASSPNPLVIFPSFLLAKLTSSKLIFESRDIWPLVLNDLSKFSKINPYFYFLKLVEIFAVKSSDLIVSVKEGDFEYYSSFFNILPDNFSFVPNGYLPQESDSQSSSSSNRLDNSFSVGYVGALSNYYQISILLEVAKKLEHISNIRFEIVGSGVHLDYFLNEKDTLGLSNVNFRGKIPKKQVIKTISNFDLCYIGLKDTNANLYGISCNKLFEYMYCKKPIIGVYKTNFDPIVKANCGYSFDCDDVDGIVSKILYLYENPDLCLELGSNGYKFFQRNHNFIKISKYLHKFLESKL